MDGRKRSPLVDLETRGERVDQDQLDPVEGKAFRFAPLGGEAFEAEVVSPSFQQRRLNRPPDCLANQRQIAMIKLVLQGLGTCADDGLSTTHECRNEVRKGLAGTSASLDNQFVAIRDSLGHSFRHPALPGSRRKAGQEVFKWALVAEEVSQRFHGEKVTRFLAVTRAVFRPQSAVFEMQYGSFRVLQFANTSV